MTTPLMLGYYIRMVVAASRGGTTLFRLRDIRLLEDDESELRRYLRQLRTAGLARLTVKESVRWGALLLYAFARCSALAAPDGQLFGDPLSSDELQAVGFGQRLWVRLSVAGTEAELAVLTAATAHVSHERKDEHSPPDTEPFGSRDGRSPRLLGFGVDPRESTAEVLRRREARRLEIAAGAAVALTKLLSSIRDYSPDWKRGCNLRRLLVTEADDVDFQQALTPWFLDKACADSPTTLGAIFILYGSRVFSREGPYNYELLEQRLGVSSLLERVATRYKAIEEGTELWFGIQLTRPQGYITTMLQHSGGGWGQVAEVLMQLDGSLPFDRSLQWDEVMEAVILLPKKRELSSHLRVIINEPETRDFVIEALCRLADACSQIEVTQRTAARLGAILAIENPGARRMLAELVGVRRKSAIAAPAVLGVGHVAGDHHAFRDSQDQGRSAPSGVTCEAPVTLGHFVRMVVVASRVGSRLIPLRNVRLLDDDEGALAAQLSQMRTSGLEQVTVEEAVCWGALLLYSFGRCSALGELNLQLFGTPLSTEELRAVESGHQMWVRLDVAASERELVALTTTISRQRASVAPAPRGLPPSTPRYLRVAAKFSLDHLMESIRDVSPDWHRGRSLRRLVVTASEEMAFEDPLQRWLGSYKDPDESPLTLGAVFFLYASRVFARETRYQYETLERRLGVSMLSEAVARRSKAIEKGTEAWFGIELSGRPEHYIGTILEHSGGGWDAVAEAAQKLDGSWRFDRALSSSTLSDALLLLPKRNDASAQLRGILRQPETREFVIGALKRLAVACSEVEPAERSAEWLRNTLDIASPDAALALAELVGVRRKVTVAPPLASLAFHLRHVAGEMPRVVVAVPPAIEWPPQLPALVTRLRLFVRGDSRGRTVVYLRGPSGARRQGACEYLELPDRATLPIEVLFETLEDGVQATFARLSLPDGVAVFATDSGKLLNKIPRTGALALVTEPGTHLVGAWGQELPSRSGIAVRIGELPAESVPLVIRRADGSEETWVLEAARQVPLVSIEGTHDGLSFASGGRVAVSRPRVRCASAPSGFVRVAVDRANAVREFDVVDGEDAMVPGMDAAGLYRLRLHPRARQRSIIYAPRARFLSSCSGDNLILEAHWSQDEPARLRIGEQRGEGTLTIALTRAENIQVLVEPPTFAPATDAIRWDVKAHPRRVEVVSEAHGPALAEPIFETLRYSGGLRLLGSPRDEVTVEPGYYRRRTLELDAQGEAFFQFALIDDNEVEENDLGLEQLIVNVTWKSPHRHTRFRIAREHGVRVNVRVLRGEAGRVVLDVDPPPGLEHGVLELLPVWKPWEGWSRLRVPAERPAGATGVTGEVHVAAGFYLCAVTDAFADGERRPRCAPRPVTINADEAEAPTDDLERVLWGRPSASAILEPFERRLRRDGDELLEGLVRVFERYGAGTFAIGAMLGQALGARRLLACANHECNRATDLELRLLALCDHERVPWSVVRRADVDAFLETIREWDVGAYALALSATCSLRAGIGFWIHQGVPDEHSAALQPFLPRFVPCWSGVSSLTLEQRDLVIADAQTEHDEGKVGPRVVALHDAKGRLAAHTIRLDRLRDFASSATGEARLDRDLLELDAALNGLARRVTAERLRGPVSEEAMLAARYAERVVPRLYEYWLEAAAAKAH